MEHFYNNIFGFFDYEDLYSDMVARVNESATFVEVGSFKGKSSAYMIVEIINSQKDIKFYCVDTFLGSSEHFKDQPHEDSDVVKGTLFESFSQNLASVKNHYIPVKSTSLEAVNKFKDKSLDFVFIDAAHDYDNVKADILAWTPKIKNGGYLGGHDYHYEPVRTAVLEVLGQCFYSKSSWLVQK